MSHALKVEDSCQLFAIAEGHGDDVAELRMLARQQYSTGILAHLRYGQGFAVEGGETGYTSTDPQPRAGRTGCAGASL